MDEQNQQQLPAGNSPNTVREPQATNSGTNFTLSHERPEDVSSRLSQLDVNDGQRDVVCEHDNQSEEIRVNHSLHEDTTPHCDHDLDGSPTSPAASASPTPS